MLWTRPRLVTALLALLLASELVRTGFVVSALPLAGPGLGLSGAQIGGMVSAHYLADALGRGPMGLVTERWGLGRVLAAGAALGLGVLALTVLAPSPLWGAVLAALWGLCFGALWPGVMSASHAYALPGRTARALTLTNLSVAPAILAGVLLVGPLMQGRPGMGWGVLLGAQALALLLALGLWRLRLPVSEGGAPPGLGGGVWHGWARVGALLPAAFAQTLAPGLLVTLAFPLLRELGLGLPDLLGPGALAGLSFGLGLFALGRVADRLHPRLALTPGLLLLALTFALAAWTGPAEVRAGGLWGLALGLGLGYSALITGWNGLVARTLPQRHRAAAWGTVMAVEALGYAVGPLLGGAAWELAGQRGVFLLGALVFGLTEVYYLWPGRGLRGASPSA